MSVIGQGIILGGKKGNPVVEENDVTFIDYDGTIRYSYSAEDFLALTALPPNPVHEGLTAQGWNWSLADAQTYVASCGKLWIGQSYVTTSGDTEIDIQLFAPRLTPYLSTVVEGTVEVDWGDGASKDTVIGTSFSTQILTPHTYAASGSYTIKIHKVSGRYALRGTDAYKIISGNRSTEIQNRVYANSVKNVRIGSGVTSIVGNPFSSCSSLSSVTIPNGVTSIGSSAFGSCYSLSSVTIPNGATSIGGSMFNGCHSLSCVVIPNSVTKIENHVFYDDARLSSVTIPNGVTIIGNNAFNGCNSLSYVTIPSSVTSIGSSAFNRCAGLSSIVFVPSTPPTVDNSNVWQGIPTDCKIIVPYSADHSILNAYQAATNYPDPTVYTYEEASA